jgi:hypothetical protein
MNPAEDAKMAANKGYGAREITDLILFCLLISFFPLKIVLGHDDTIIEKSHSPIASTSAVQPIQSVSNAPRRSVRLRDKQQNRPVAKSTENSNQKYKSIFLIRITGPT